MSDIKELIESLESDISWLGYSSTEREIIGHIKQAIKLLKEQEHLKLKMWNALYAEEDKLEKKFIGTEKHDDWFNVYRPWLQSGFEIAITVIAEQDGM